MTLSILSPLISVLVSLITAVSGVICPGFAEKNTAHSDNARAYCVTEEAADKDIPVSGTAEYAQETQTYTEDTRPMTLAEAVIEAGIPEKSCGVLSVPDIGLSVPLYDVPVSRSQEAVDAENSAAVFAWGGNTVIADHSHHGFWRIRGAVPDVTMARIRMKDRTENYICIAVIPDGWNDSTQLSFSDHSSVSDVYSGKLVMYTCNPNGTVTIAVWEAAGTS